MIYYSRYVKKGEYYEGTGSKITEDVESFFKNDSRFVRLTAELESGTLFENGVDEFYEFHRRIFSSFDDIKRQIDNSHKYLNDSLNAAETIQDSIKETNDYIKKRTKGSEDLTVKRYLELTNEFEELQKEKENIVNYSDESKLIERMAFQYGPLGKDDFLKEGENYHCSKFTFDRKWFYEEMKKASVMVMLFNLISEGETIIHGNRFKKDTKITYEKISHDTNTNKALLLEKISACMNNVRFIHSLDLKSGEIKITPLPMNIFGEITLMILDAFKKDMAFINCEVCNQVKRMKRESSHICRTCQNASYQRKNTIKKDIKKGLSLNEILAKHPRMKKDEIIEHYNDLISKQNK